MQEQEGQAREVRRARAARSSAKEALRVQQRLKEGDTAARRLEQASSALKDCQKEKEARKAA